VGGQKNDRNVAHLRDLLRCGNAVQGAGESKVHQHQIWIIRERRSNRLFSLVDRGDDSVTQVGQSLSEIERDDRFIFDN
jgi:hypothetical protein